VVELRFFGGLSVEESAEVLKVSEVTVRRDWQFASSGDGDLAHPGTKGADRLAV
jgi:hypothetical protein